jgi:hypothetical protein
MWFAALGRFDEERWLQNLCVSSKTTAKCWASGRNPFQGRAPNYLGGPLSVPIF